MEKRRVSRRTFLAGATGVLAGCATGKAPGVINSRSPNEKLNIASIGCGGQGGTDIGGIARGRDNIVALCDIDFARAKRAVETWPDVPRYSDYRVMLEKEKHIDALNISTPDHHHAPAAMLAMSLGISVYVQKPMAHSVWEARRLTEAAREYGVVTQMGNQGHAASGTRIVCETIWDGAIGDVREVHCWTDRPGGRWTRPQDDPLPKEPVPEGFDWDVWLGPAPVRPHNSRYYPGNWRMWWDFGCGALGDMACHIMDPANWALHLGAPSSVECVKQDGCTVQTAPQTSVLKFTFPTRTHEGKALPPVTLYWHDGCVKPPSIEGVDPALALGEKDGKNGCLFIGDKGMLTCGTYGNSPRLVPDDVHADYQRPDETIPRTRGPYKEWLAACKGLAPAGSNFDYAGPLSETVLLGNIALRVGGRIDWDSANLRITNNADANQYVNCNHREGWPV
jgi:predicted dehydrogenase